MRLIDLVIYGFATWRVASLLVNENGPWNLFVWLRELTGIEHEDGEVFIIPSGFWPDLFSCVWCCSMWVAFFWLVFWMAWPWMALRVAIMFSFSTVAILVDKRLGE